MSAVLLDVAAVSPRDPEGAAPCARSDDRAPPASPASSKRLALLLLKGGISAALLTLVLSRVSPERSFAALARVDLRFVAVAVCLQLCGSWLTAARWGGLLGAQGFAIAHGTLFRSCMAAAFVRQLLPSTIGGDTIRAYDSWRAGATPGASVTALAVDRVLGLLALCLLGAAALTLPSEVGAALPGLRWWVMLFAAGAVVGTWVIFSALPQPLALARRVTRLAPGPARRLVDRLLDAAAAYRGKRAVLARAVALSFLLQVVVVTFYAAIGWALGLDIAYLRYYTIVPPATLILLLPVSINGIGLREGVFAALLAAHGVPAHEAVAFAWLEYAVFLLYGVLGGLVYTWCRGASLPALKLPEGSR